MIKKLSYVFVLLILVGLLAFVTINLAATAQAITVHRETGPAIDAGTGFNMSHNWAGYVSTGGTFTSVKGSWVVPAVNSTTTSADATWIGIGGITSTDLIQTGTQAIVKNGKVTYQAWYEILPGNSHKIPVTISPGDTITASVSQQSQDQWTITLVDVSTGQNYETTVTYTSSLSSAEWIEEMPSFGRSYIPLDNFGQVEFSGMSTVKDGKELTPSQANAFSIAMVDNFGQVIAQPSALGTDGSGFTIDRTASPSSQIVYIIGRTGWRIIAEHGHQPSYRTGHGRGRYGGGYEKEED